MNKTLATMFANANLLPVDVNSVNVRFPTDEAMMAADRADDAGIDTYDPENGKYPVRNFYLPNA